MFYVYLFKTKDEKSSNKKRSPFTYYNFDYIIIFKFIKL